MGKIIIAVIQYFVVLLLQNARTVEEILTFKIFKDDIRQVLDCMNSRTISALQKRTSRK